MTKRFRIAISYAGEKRDFVAPVANILARRFGQERVLYDKFHRAEFARGDLATYLPALYLEEADLVVTVICKDYDREGMDRAGVGRRSQPAQAAEAGRGHAVPVRLHRGEGPAGSRRVSRSR